MKIILVYQMNLFKNEQGGGIRYVKNLINGIKKYCDEILFLGIGDKETQIDNIYVRPVTSKMTNYIKFLFNLFLKLPFIKTNDYQIVHVHRSYFAIPFIFLKPKLKIVCTLHGRTFSVFESNFGKNKLKIIRPFFRMIEKFSLKHIDFLVPVSEDVLNHFYKKYPKLIEEKKENIKILGSMMDLSNFKIKDSDFLQKRFGKNKKFILFLGRLADVKDIEFLINMFCEKFSNDDSVKLVIAGRGEKEEELKKFAKEKCKKNSPIFLGEVKSNEVPNLIASANVVVLTSKHEASPTVVKEALSSGIPVVTNNVGDVKKFIINDKNGYIVEKNYDEYYKALKSIIDNSNKFNKKKVYEISKDKLIVCTIDYISKKYVEIYKKVIE